jgi:hypothetical protein
VPESERPTFVLLSDRRALAEAARQLAGAEYALDNLIHDLEDFAARLAAVRASLVRADVDSSGHPAGIRDRKPTA